GFEREHVGGAVGWYMARRHALNSDDRAILEVVEHFYARAGAPHRECDDALRQMRLLADKMAFAGALGGPAMRFLERETARETIVIFAWLQIGLAVKLNREDATTGEIPRWADIGHQWHSLRKTDPSAPPPPLPSLIEPQR